METQQQVWVRDTTEGFIIGNITEILVDGVEVTPADAKLNKRICSFDDIFPSGEYHKDVDDNCEMMYLNEATLLNNIRTRYRKDKIYTYVANILIAVNPYTEIKELYSPKTIKTYQGKSLGERPPHVFAIADKTFRDMKVLKQSQSIIVSGESGAGKTESTKYILKYLCDLYGSTAGPVEKKILDANPVLEAFGNAKTIRNNNSSRFGKFIEVHFNSKYQVVGGFISHYLLEKSRLCVQGPEERNYHVFYMLCAGAPEHLRNKLFITKPDDFQYLRHGCTQYFTTPSSESKLTAAQKSKAHATHGGLRDPLLDDVDGFVELDQALARLGLDEKRRFEVYVMVASVLHLGNIAFEENPEDAKGGSRVSAGSERSLTIAANLMGIDPVELRQALVSRVMQSSRGGVKGTVIMVPLKIYEANNARDALAKAVYNKLFDHIVNCINKSIPFQASSYYIGVLDIAGFEFFTVNSFEQFCINYCNEKLQQFFNERLLKQEQQLYKKEGLNVPEIKFVDNQDCIDLVEGKNTGIFSILDEESKLPKPSFNHFTSEVHSRWPNHFRITLPRASRLKSHRTIRDDEGFVIRHFAGGVCYQTNQFIEKNNDALHASLEGLVQESENPLMKMLFAGSNLSSQKGKLNFISVGSKFKTQLGELMEKLQCNGTNFVRCIKPNNKMIGHQFEGGLCLTQLKCSGMTTVLELMSHGYPSRAPFEELHSIYKQYLPKELLKLDARSFCEAMLHSLHLHDKDFKFGVTRVFFRPGKFAEFDKIMKSDPENLKSIAIKVKKWLIKSRWAKSQFCALSVIKLKNKILYRRNALITIQKFVRGYTARKRHMPRYKGLAKIEALKNKLKEMSKTVENIKKDKDVCKSKIAEIRSDIEAASKRIRTDANFSAASIENKYNQLLDSVNDQMRYLEETMHRQKNAEEQERLRKIQEQIERERLLKEEEERRKQEEEEIRRKKAELEARRKLDEELRRKQEEEEQRAEAALKAQREKEAHEHRLRQQQLEQERHDHEIALRLAQESNGQLEDSPPTMRRSETVRNQQAAQSNKKYDLSKWKYSELRDTINTSCDIELLEACRHEFHRRLKVYHAWKAKNRRRTMMDDNERAPRSVMDAASKAPKMQQKVPILEDTQRYFRIPFIRPAILQPVVLNGNAEGKQQQQQQQQPATRKGWWYAHFDGQYVARQMELHPDKPPILLLAGVDDMQMCELSLDETGLTRKRGAEILETEFNREWERNGGRPYTKNSERRK